MFRWIRPLRKQLEVDASIQQRPKPFIEIGTLLRHLEWTAIKPLQGWLQGDHKTLVRGAGLDFAELREYQSNDDVRHIDWLVTARTQTLHVRTYTQDRDITGWLLVDMSGSMRLCDENRSKQRQAIRLCGVLAGLFTGLGNSIGLMSHSGHQSNWGQVIPTSKGRRHTLRIMNALNDAIPDTPHPTTQLALLLGDAMNRIKRRSTVFIISDFISSDAWDHALQMLALRHDVIAIRMHDALENSIPHEGLLALRDNENGEIIWIDGSDLGLRERIDSTVAAHRNKLRESFAKAGIDAIELASDDDVGKALFRFIQLRQPRNRAKSVRTTIKDA